MISFAIYSYEGIGLVMPVAEACATPKKFNGIMIAAIATITVELIFFGTLGYLTYGSDMDQQIITEMLPAGNFVVIFLKLAFCLCIFLAFPLHVTPLNSIVEGNLISSCLNRPNWSEQARTWARNASRFLICLVIVSFAVLLADKLDKFLSLLGALFCSPLALTIPAVLHLKLIATTRSEKIKDLTLIAISLGILIFCVTETFLQW